MSYEMVDVLEEHRSKVRRLESEHIAKGYELDVERLKVKAIEELMKTTAERNTSDEAIR